MPQVACGCGFIIIVIIYSYYDCLSLWGGRRRKTNNLVWLLERFSFFFLGGWGNPNFETTPCGASQTRRLRGPSGFKGTQGAPLAHRCKAPTNPPTNPPTHQPTNPPTHQPTNPPTHPPTHQPTNPPTNPPTNQPTTQPTNQPTSPLARAKPQTVASKANTPSGFYPPAKNKLNKGTATHCAG